MVRDRTSRRIAVAVTLLTVVAAIAAVVAIVAGGGEEPKPVAVPVTQVTAGDFRQRTLDRTTGAGYAAWVGAWTMPGGAIMAGWTRAEGPLDPGAREDVPDDVLEDFGLDRAELPANRDFWGLDLSVLYARTPDGGESFDDVREDPFEAIAPHAYSQQATTALPDGTLLRRVNGDDLRQDDSIPHTAFLERLEPGRDEWSEPQVLLDPERTTYQITRIRRLSDGRMIATGNAWDVPASTTPAERRGEPSRFIVMVSNDDGRSWQEALTIPESVGELPGNEWDTAELPGGDLLAVMRTADGHDAPDQVVKQARLRQEGRGWVLEDLRPAPFRVTGHPELLNLRDGAILYVATDGIRWTQDGSRWTPLTWDDGESQVSHYYPRSVQDRDGTVHVFSHLGADDPYEDGDHGVVHDRFSVDVLRASDAATAD